MKCEYLHNANVIGNKHESKKRSDNQTQTLEKKVTSLEDTLRMKDQQLNEAHSENKKLKERVKLQEEPRTIPTSQSYP